jgi:chitinase
LGSGSFIHTLIIMRFTLSSYIVAAVLFAVTTVDAAFDMTKNDNLVLYWGQDAHGSYDKNDANGQKDLLTYCSGE